MAILMVVITLCNFTVIGKENLWHKMRSFEQFVVAILKCALLCAILECISTLEMGFLTLLCRFKNVDLCRSVCNTTAIASTCSSTTHTIDHFYLQLMETMPKLTIQEKNFVMRCDGHGLTGPLLQCWNSYTKIPMQWDLTSVLAYIQGKCSPMQNPHSRKMWTLA